nr:GDP fucose protein O fucosyltransferase 2 [Hymenolepis microstoma]
MFDMVLREASQYPLSDPNSSNYSTFDWVLVLPPWTQTFHWKHQNASSALPQPWSKFFDLESLRLFIPVIEFDDFLQIVSMDQSRPEVDIALQVNQVPLSENKREVKLDEPKFLPECGRFACGDQNMPNIEMDPGNRTRVYFDHSSDEYALKTSALYCLYGVLQAVELAPFLSRYIEQNPNIRTVFIGSAENLINGVWSEWSQQYWTARRSMVFASHLTVLADSFRLKHLNSDDVSDQTTPPPSWLNRPWPQSPALGGPYFAIHWRRGDFPRSPSPYTAAMQTLQAIKQSIKFLEPFINESSSLSIYLATDADLEDCVEFQRLVAPHKVYRFIDKSLLPGEVAIIDQWICAHARFFVGSVPSTFTFRIAEEREIIGFPSVTTFNSLCDVEGSEVVLKDDPLDSSNCEGLVPWTINLEPRYTIFASQVKYEL